MATERQTMWPLPSYKGRETTYFLPQDTNKNFTESVSLLVPSQLLLPPFEICTLSNPVVLQDLPAAITSGISVLWRLQITPAS